MISTRIIAIRHGETAWNASTRIQGHTDIPLNEHGQRQAQLLAQALAQHPLPDVLRTFTEHAASRVANDLRFGAPGTALLSGGGVHNEFFVRRLKHLAPRPLEVLDAHRSNFKEAAAFALLAALKVRGENNVLASVTGAERDHSAGRILKIHS